MGFDLIGLMPKSPKGEFFRNNIWWWPRLWEFVCQTAGDILTEEDKRYCRSNNGHIISTEKAEVIARRLQEILLQRDLYEEQVEATAWTMKQGVERVIMAALKQALGESYKEAEVVPNQSSYHFSWENVQGFAEFCQDSGGFRVC